MIKKTKWLVVLTVLVVPFQNCTSRNSSQSHTQDSTSKNIGTDTSMNGGQPYDGKPFVLSGTCGDGTIVDTRIVMKDRTATLYRENCQTTSPRTLTAVEVQEISSGEVRYRGSVLREEKPSIPLPGVVSWFLQLTGILRPRPASLYIVDMFSNSASQIASLKASGHTVLCAISAGTVESWNPDAGEFLPAEIGRAVPDGPGERYLDIRSANVRRIMLNRIALAKSKGCDGIDFDSADGFVNNTGFPLTRNDQLTYNQSLAFAAHDRALVLTLNAVPELADVLANIFDIAVADSCFTYNECASYRPFIIRNKPVLVVEYGPLSPAWCAEAKNNLLSLSFLNVQLDGSRYETCP